MSIKREINPERLRALNKRMRQIRIAFFIRLKLGVLDKIIDEALKNPWTYPDPIWGWIDQDLEPLHIYQQLVGYLVHRRRLGDHHSEVTIEKWRWLWGRFRDQKRYALRYAYNVFYGE